MKSKNINRWRTLSSAPKDGTYVLLYSPHHEKKIWVGKHFKNEHYIDGRLVYKKDGWCSTEDVFGLNKTYKPTHWHPIPNPPAEVKLS